MQHEGDEREQAGRVVPDRPVRRARRRTGQAGEVGAGRRRVDVDQCLGQVQVHGGVLGAGGMEPREVRDRGGRTVVPGRRRRFPEDGTHPGTVQPALLQQQVGDLLHGCGRVVEDLGGLGVPPLPFALRQRVPQGAGPAEGQRAGEETAGPGLLQEPVGRLGRETGQGADEVGIGAVERRRGPRDGEQPRLAAGQFGHVLGGRRGRPGRPRAGGVDDRAVVPCRQFVEGRRRGRGHAARKVQQYGQRLGVGGAHQLVDEAERALVAPLRVTDGEDERPTGQKTADHRVRRVPRATTGGRCPEQASQHRVFGAGRLAQAAHPPHVRLPSVRGADVVGDGVHRGVAGRVEHHHAARAAVFAPDRTGRRPVRRGRSRDGPGPGGAGAGDW